MRILTVDVGTGTQDILLFDSEQPVENGLQLGDARANQIVARAVPRQPRIARRSP